MAGFFQQFLRGAADGFLGSPYMRDYKHAAKTFLPNAYQNTPKFKWLFHTYFYINPLVLNAYPRLPLNANYGLLVKSIELPKYQFNVVELNQYNRKRYAQTKISYEPVRVTFHDDNANQIRNLYFQYYSYNYNDPSRPSGINGPNDAINTLSKKDYYDNKILPEVQNWGYNGAPTGVATNPYIKYPFFSAIKIYGFNQHNFALYTLINPIITDFNHDTYAYASSTETMECTMTIKYETVKYYEGAINGQTPSTIVEQFGIPENYDTDLSPNNIPGTNRSILGAGGLVDTAQGIISDLTNVPPNPLSALQAAGRLGRTFKNPQSILQTAKTELIAGAISATPNITRSVFNFPAQGSNAGNGGQRGNATNTPNVNAPAVNVSSNTPISGGRGGP